MTSYRAKTDSKCQATFQGDKKSDDYTVVTAPEPYSCAAFGIPSTVEETCDDRDDMVDDTGLDETCAQLLVFLS